MILPIFRKTILIMYLIVVLLNFGFIMIPIEYLNQNPIGGEIQEYTMPFLDIMILTFTEAVASVEESASFMDFSTFTGGLVLM